MKANYKHLTNPQRHKIEAWLESGLLQKDIATKLGVDPATVSRERKRRQKNGLYIAEVAIHKTQVKRGNSKWTGMKIEKYPSLKARIITGLEAKQSPEAIAGRLKEEDVTPRVTSETIYQWLYSARGLSYSSFLCTRRRRRKRQKPKRTVTVIKDRIPIQNRPKEGIHAEADTFHSPKSSLSSACVAIVVRPDTKEISLKKARNQSPSTLATCFKASVAELKPDTLTFDNGLENRDHFTLGIPTFFCDPGSPKQKPYVENAIKQVRAWYLKKGTDLSCVSQKDLDQMAESFNQKYRKSLGYLSPKEKRAMLEVY
jgi:transposase, IS30 family